MLFFSNIARSGAALKVYFFEFSALKIFLGRQICGQNTGKNLALNFERKEPLILGIKTNI